MLISRRSLGQITLSGLTASARLLAQRKIPLAVQLYSVRQIAAKDLSGVLKQVSKLGYQGVEFAGYYNHPAKDIKTMLDDNNLKAAGTHIQLDTMLGENLAPTLEFNRTIGNKNLIVPGLGQKYRASIAAWKDTAKIFNEISDKVRPQGFDVGYHNHTQEFQAMDGQLPFDAFFQVTKPAVKVQLDIGHARRAGADPVDIIQRYKGRIISVHVKEYSPDNPEPALGDGVIKWKDVFSALEAVGGTEWYIAEEEGKSCKEYECIAGAIERLRKMGK
jgi:sugar phosphate isomerase/epimerase